MWLHIPSPVTRIIPFRLNGHNYKLQLNLCYTNLQILRVLTLYITDGNLRQTRPTNYSQEHQYITSVPPCPLNHNHDMIGVYVHGVFVRGAFAGVPYELFPGAKALTNTDYIYLSTHMVRVRYGEK